MYQEFQFHWKKWAHQYFQEILDEIYILIDLFAGLGFDQPNLFWILFACLFMKADYYQLFWEV